MAPKASTFQKIPSASYRVIDEDNVVKEIQLTESVTIDGVQVSPGSRIRFGFGPEGDVTWIKTAAPTTVASVTFPADSRLWFNRTAGKLEVVAVQLGGDLRVGSHQFLKGDDLSNWRDGAPHSVTLTGEHKFGDKVYGDKEDVNFNSLGEVTERKTLEDKQLESRRYEQKAAQCRSSCLGEVHEVECANRCMTR